MQDRQKNMTARAFQSVKLLLRHVNNEKNNTVKAMNSSSVVLENVFSSYKYNSPFFISTYPSFF